MQGLAEVEGNPMKIKEAQQRLQRDIAPLAKEVARALEETGAAATVGGGGSGGGREELFYQAQGRNGGPDTTMESLIGNSESMLRETLS
jgi:hypothetical protein